MKYIKFKNLPKNWSLVGRHFKGNKDLTIESGWPKGLWLRNNGTSQILPMFFKDFDQIKDKMISLFTHEEIMMKLEEQKEAVK